MATIIRANDAVQSARLRAVQFGELDETPSSDCLPHAVVMSPAATSNQPVEALQALAKVIEQFEQSRAAWLAHWEQQAIHLAVAIAGRITRREARRSPEIALDLVRESLELAAGSPEIHLRLHPDDCTALGAHLERLVAEASRIGKVTIAADARIERSSCVVETRFGVIDQQFETQLDRIEQELLD